ncbi:MAG: hypothetical protein HZB34_09385 [Nitrospirae bacterium]|nr:hypothetical protein [Nitrospirota bacterium]
MNQTNPLSRYSRSLGFTAALLLCAGIATAPAMASSVPITFTFTGKVTEVGYEMGEHFGGPFRLDKPVTGSYTFNPDTPNTGSGSIGQYNGALNDPLNNYPSTNLHVEIETYNGTYVASLGSGDNKIVVKNPDNFNYESYQVKGAFSGDPVTGHNPESFALELAHPGSNQFDNVSLPTTPPTISGFAVKEFRLVFAHSASPDRHTVVVTLETLTAVPLPPAVILFGAGLVALIGLGVRRKVKVEAKVE